MRMVVRLLWDQTFIYERQLLAEEARPRRKRKQGRSDINLPSAATEFVQRRLARPASAQWPGLAVWR